MMMTNDELAQELRGLADLMTIAGEDVYRARSLTRVADAIEGMDESIASIAQAGKLNEIKGVGASTAKTILQLLETGECDKRKAVEEKVPATALDLLEIPWLGMKTAQRLYKERQIASIEQLEAALDDGSFLKMKGFTAKTVGVFRDGIARFRRRKTERPLQEALSVGAQMAEALKESGAPQAEVSGAARRARETCVGVRVTAETAQTDQAAEALQKIGFESSAVGNVVKGTIAGGFPAVVTFAAPGSFHAAWLRETADAEHLDALNERAESRGLPPLNDNGAWGNLSEEQVYAKLGLPFIPPEMREGRAAVEKADENGLPALIQESDYRGDLHSHTNASDGANSIEEMAEAAAALGREYQAITDHSRSSGYAGGLSAERLMRQIDEAREANEKMNGRITLLAGSEVDILANGRLDYPDSILEKLDWVVASAHSLFNLSEEAQTERLCKAMENPFVRVLGHPTGRQLGRRDPYPVCMETLIEKAVETGTALELNASPARLDLSAEHCRRAVEAGALISINADAHRAATLENIRYGIMTARRAWLEPRHVINTWDLERVKTLGTANAPSGE